MRTSRTSSARAYMAGKTAHISGVTANGDTLTVRLVAPAPDFPSRIAMTAFCAVPTNAPPDRNGDVPIPSAGPYYVSSYVPNHSLVLLRNPNYGGHRPHHFARIELTVGVSDERAIPEVEAGTADYISVGLGSSASTTLTNLASGLATRYGPGSAAAAHGSEQYFVDNSFPQLDLFILNTHRPLFSDARMRRAVNYAINREQLAQFGDAYNPLPAHPTSHYLPPGVPGYRDVSVYPSTPDLATARKLARGRGGTAALYTCDASSCPEQAQIVKTDLALIGLQVQITELSSTKLLEAEAQLNPPFDLAWFGWIPDYLDPSAMLNPLLADSSWAPPFADRAYQRRLAAADKVSGPQRYLNYGTLDLDLTRNAAPLLAFDNLSSRDFFSARIGCQTFGVYGIDLAALCLRQTNAEKCRPRPSTSPRPPAPLPNRSDPVTTSAPRCPAAGLHAQLSTSQTKYPAHYPCGRIGEARSRSAQAPATPSEAATPRVDPKLSTLDGSSQDFEVPGAHA